ncbi:MAG: phosphoribosylglycinamide formyltransferase [Bacteroidia bacterium]|nr:phosphoribosylglycinamide formyltransferase [Bacteroidia bacterium]
MKKRVQVGIFASGNGTNAQTLIDYFQNSTTVEIAAIFSNRADAFVCERARKSNLSCVIFNNQQASDEDYLLEKLHQYRIQLIVLAGYLRLIPEKIIQQYPERIVNVHPALLPKFGGKDMYGLKVHEAVMAAQEPVTGVTFHIVNTAYDQGRILFQAETPITYPTTPTEIAKKVQILEHQYFPRIIESLSEPIYQQINLTPDGKTY